MFRTVISLPDQTAFSKVIIKSKSYTKEFVNFKFGSIYQVHDNNRVDQISLELDEIEELSDENDDVNV